MDNTYAAYAEEYLDQINGWNIRSKVEACSDSKPRKSLVFSFSGIMYAGTRMIEGDLSLDLCLDSKHPGTLGYYLQTRDMPVDLGLHFIKDQFNINHFHTEFKNYTEAQQFVRYKHEIILPLPDSIIRTLGRKFIGLERLFNH